MRFWCSALEVPWSWEWRAYPGVWAASAALAVGYLWARRRDAIAHRALARQRPHASARLEPLRRPRPQTYLYLGGVAAFWLASDWPLGVLGAGYLASAHMLQFMIYTLAAAPLLVLGVPEPMARRLLAKVRLYRIVSRLSRPVTAGLVFNGCLLATHSPWAVDTLRTSQLGSFSIDLLWLASGILVWLPICSPLVEHRLRSYPAKMVYLFAALGVVPAVPAGFLTFAGFPLYATYELAPRFYGLDAATDQQIAGLIMKLGGIPIVWGAIIAMMLRWADEARTGLRSLGPEAPSPAAGSREARRSPAHPEAVEPGAPSREPGEPAESP